MLLKHCIIAISRQYGSGGRGIGKKLADDLGIKCYDKELITLAADRSGFSEGYVEEIEENLASSFVLSMNFNAYHGFDSVGYYDTPTTDKMFIAQSSVIRELAGKDSCVIIGRCADYILRDREDLARVFIRAEHAQRVRRAIEEYDLPRKDALTYVKKTDKTRENYYKFYTNRPWGSAEHTDLMINTTFTGEDGAVEVIKAMLRARGSIR